MRLACTGLFSWFEKRATIVTPSPVLAAVAAEQFSRDQLERGVESWERPAVFDINTWLANYWHEALYTGSEIPILLSPAQEHLLWRSVIEQEQPELFDLNATARLARRAAKLIAEWHIPTENDLWSDHEDAQQFLYWQQLFARKCRSENWITRSDLWRLLPSWISSGLCSPGLTVFFGFTPTTPGLERIKQALGGLAATEGISIPQRRGRVPVKSWDDFNQETEEAARWARAAFEQQTSRSICIFVPDLSTHRARVERVFQQVFYPSAAVRPNSLDSVFHVNSAAPLENEPLIASALLLLELAQPRIDQRNACAILRCPFITGAAPERSARAFADLELRRGRALDVTLREMESAANNCAELVRIWPAVRQVLGLKSQCLDLPAWSKFIGDLLGAVGWPGDAELNSQEQEVIDKWKDALSKLASLGLVCGQVSFDTALSHLRGLLSRRGIERGDWLSPIQILDASDAPGLEFDAAFLTGLSGETWPARAYANPLLPLKLQRAYHLPSSSPQSVQRESEGGTEALFRVAPVLFATYSARLAPLVEPFVKHTAIEYPRWAGKVPRQSYAPASLNEIADESGPRYEEREGTRGGISIIKSQSLCPFRAFAEFRLAATPPDDACLGFDSRDRGGFVHKALQFVWEDLKTQDQLRKATTEELRAIVHDAVTKSVKDNQSTAFHTLASQTERERLEKLILEWLGFEQKRTQPFTVETVEQKREYDLPGLRLSLRVDRMDRLKNGKLLLIDYKSGQQKQSCGKLKCPRPVEPQLLVYASAVGSEVDGVFFGEIKSRGIRAVGISREKHFSERGSEIRRDWDSFLAESRDEVERIAREFVDGYAAVDPLRNACEYCSINPLCRVNEIAGTEQEDE